MLPCRSVVARSVTVNCPAASARAAASSAQKSRKVGIRVWFQYKLAIMRIVSIVTVIALSLVALVASAQAPPAAPAAAQTAVRPDGLYATFETSMGNIVVK